MPEDIGAGDYACLGNPFIHTPAADAFEKQSLTFTQFPVSPICADQAHDANSMNTNPRFLPPCSGPTNHAPELTPTNRFLTVVFPGFRPCLLTAAMIFFLPTSLLAALPAYIPQDAVFQQDAQWLQTYTAGLVNTNRATYKDGRTVFYCDAEKHYGLMFTRDFGYFVEFAGDLISPKETSGYLEFLLAGQREDGCIPDRVTVDGEPIYSPGPPKKPMADHALENASFLVSAFCRYVERTGDLDFLRRHENALRRGLDHINRAENGLVYNRPDNPQCVYGYTDTVRKTGHLLMESALYYEACSQMAILCRKAGIGEPDEYLRRAELIKKNIGRLWDRDSGAFYAADGLCRQYDVWGTAFVLDRNLATKEQEQKALSFLVNNYDRYAQKGQIRHLLTYSSWQSTFNYRQEGVYQNGGYWATPLGWLVPVLARRDPALAQRTLRECLADFRARGIHEWINGGVTVLPDFFNSAISVYSLLHEEKKVH